MEIEFVKAAISRKTGIPVNLLDGQTAEEIDARAKTLLSIKDQNYSETPKSPREQFAEYFSDQLGDGYTIQAGNPVQDAKTVPKRPISSYPVLPDGGSPYMGPDPEYNGTPREQFAQYFAEKSAFNPFVEPGGWIRII